MKLQFAILLACAGLAFGQTGNADNYLDEILKNAKNLPDVRQKIDPLHVDDVSFSHGKATGITVKGLLSLDRNGPATLTDRGNGNFGVEAHLGLDHINVDAHYEYKALFKFHGGFGAKIDRISCTLRIAINNGHANLEGFDVGALDGMKVTHFSGASKVFNWLGKIIANEIVKKNRDKIRHKIEEGAREAISKALRNVDISKFIPK